MAIDNELAKLSEDLDEKSTRYDSVGDALTGVATTVGGAVSGAVGATLGLPTDLVGILSGLKEAATAEDGKRLDAFADGFSEFSKENLGSQYYKGVFDKFVDSLDIDNVLKNDAKAGFSAGELITPPIAGGGAVKAVTKIDKIKDEFSRAEAMAVKAKENATRKVDEIGKEFDDKAPKTYTRSEVMAMTAKREPSPVRQMTETERALNIDKINSFNSLRRGSEIKIDNPPFKDAITGETYVAKKIRENNTYKQNNPNSGPIGLYEGITGTANNIKFNPQELINVKGEMGEDVFRMTGNAGQETYNKLQALKKSIKEKGYKPTNIKITVTEDGTPYITEGNHRLAEALQSKRPEIIADVNYLRGGENADGILNPKKIGIRADKETDQMISVFPKPERMFPKGEAPKGGDYLNPKTGDVLTDRNVSSANIKINPDGKPSFNVSNDNVDSVGTVGKGNSQIKTNLFKKKAGWKWTDTPSGMDNVETLVSVTHKGKHFYTIETDFTKGVNLKKYPNQKTEPKLRPTVVGQIELGEPIGEISVRGNPHKVYNKIKTFNRGGLMART